MTPVKPHNLRASCTLLSDCSLCGTFDLSRIGGRSVRFSKRVRFAEFSRGIFVVTPYEHRTRHFYCCIKTSPVSLSTVLIPGQTAVISFTLVPYLEHACFTASHLQDFFLFKSEWLAPIFVVLSGTWIFQYVALTFACKKSEKSCMETCVQKKRPSTSLGMDAFKCVFQVLDEITACRTVKQKSWFQQAERSPHDLKKNAQPNPNFLTKWCSGQKSMYQQEIFSFSQFCNKILFLRLWHSKTTQACSVKVSHRETDHSAAHKTDYLARQGFFHVTALTPLLGSAGVSEK